MKKREHWDFPAGSVVKNLPSNAGGMGLILCQGTKILHAMYHALNQRGKKKNKTVFSNGLQLSKRVPVFVYQ